jgi:hypothetical protein
MRREDAIHAPFALCMIVENATVWYFTIFMTNAIPA